jgi:hypothetical protein
VRWQVAAFGDGRGGVGLRWVLALESSWQALDLRCRRVQGVCNRRDRHALGSKLVRTQLSFPVGHTAASIRTVAAVCTILCLLE